MSLIKRAHPVFRDLMLTAATSFASFLASLVLISIFGRLLGVTLLAEYLLLRRVASWLQPLTYLGLGVALPRYVAYSTQQSPTSRLGYFVAAAACIVVFGSLLGVVLGVARRPLGTILFGDAELARLMVPLFLLMLGGAAQVTVYGFYRGCLKMKHAGAMQFCTAVVPIISTLALFRTHSVVLIVSAIGYSVAGVAVVFAIPIVQDLHRYWNSIQNVGARARELLKYGVSRVPGDLSNGALLAIGPVFAAHYMPVSRVSYLLVAISMLAAASVSTDPLGLVFLSKISMMMSDDRLDDVRIYLSHLISATVDLSVFLTLQLIVFADVLLRAWVGASLLEGITVIRIVLIGIPCYLFHTALRSAVDAGSIRPLNARNILVSLIAFLIMIGLSAHLAPREFVLHAVAISLTLAFTLLAYATRMSLTELYGVQVQWRESGVPIFCAMVLAVLGLMYRKISNGSLLHLAVLELVFSLVFLGVCFCSGVRWVQLLAKLVFRPRSTREITDPLVQL